MLSQCERPPPISPNSRLRRDAMGPAGVCATAAASKDCHVPGCRGPLVCLDASRPHAHHAGQAPRKGDVVCGLLEATSSRPRSATSRASPPATRRTRRSTGSRTCRTSRSRRTRRTSSATRRPTSRPRTYPLAASRAQRRVDDAARTRAAFSLDPRAPLAFEGRASDAVTATRSS